MKIGARVLKTGLAITLSIYASILLFPDSSGALAGIAASLSTQPSVKKSFETFISRVVANSIGGLLAVLMIYAIGNSPIAIGVSAVLAIAVLNGLKLSDVIPLTIVTIVVIMLSTDTDYIMTAFARVIETVIGVSISFVINLLIHPPKHDAQFFKTLETVTSEVLLLLRATLRKNTDFSILHRDLQWAKKQMSQFNTLFRLISEEWIISKSERVARARKLVIYRHMGRTTQSAIDLLDALHKYSHIYYDFPDEFRTIFRERLETLFTAHEQIIMKFYGKVPPEAVNYMEMNREYREDYLNMFFTEARHQEDVKEHHQFEANGVTHIMAASFTYEEKLTNLNRLVRNYKLQANGQEYDTSHDDLRN